MNIKFWGVRGSIPSNLMTQNWAQHFENLMRDFFASGYRSADQIELFMSQKSLPEIGGFGSGTTCVEVIRQNKSLIIDCGSGIKNLSDHLVKSGQILAQDEYHIFMSHFHFDHIMGIPFFVRKINQITSNTNRIQTKVVFFFSI